MTPFGKENYFYEAQVRQCVAAFGVLFSDMYVKRDVDLIKVPLRYGGGYLYEKTPQDSQARETTKVKVLPALAYTFGSIVRDTSRTTQKYADIAVGDRFNGQDTVLFGRVPYNIDFALTFRTKYTTEDLQILEQICAAFAPSITIQISPLLNTKGDGLKQDVIIVLESVGEQPEDFDGTEESKFYERTFTFTLKTYLYPKPQRVYVINEMQLNTQMDELGIEQQLITDLETLSLMDATAQLESATKPAKKPKKNRTND